MGLWTNKGHYICYSSVVHGPAASTSPGSSLDMHDLGPRPRPPESESALFTRSLGDLCAQRSSRSVIAGNDACSSVVIACEPSGVGLNCILARWAVRGDCIYSVQEGILSGLSGDPESVCLSGPPPSDPASLFSRSSGTRSFTGLMAVTGTLDTGPQGNLGMGEAIVWPCAPMVRGPGHQAKGKGW